MIHIEEILVMKKNLVVKVIIGGNMFFSILMGILMIYKRFPIILY